MWDKIKRAFVAFEMYTEALMALPAIVFGGFVVVARVIRTEGTAF